MKSQYRRPILLSRSRSQHGFYLLELLVTIGISMLVGAAIARNMSEYLRLSSTTQSQVIAATIAQGLIDNARSMSFDDLESYAALGPTYSLVVNDLEASGTIGPGFHPNPLLVDTTNLQWSSQAQANAFKGNVTETFTQDDPANDGPIEVKVTVTWQESNATKEYEAATVIRPFGINIDDQNDAAT